MHIIFLKGEDLFFAFLLFVYIFQFFTHIKLMDKINEILRQLEIAESKLRDEAPKKIGRNLGKCLSLREKYNKLLK